MKSIVGVSGWARQTELDGMLSTLKSVAPPHHAISSECLLNEKTLTPGTPCARLRFRISSDAKRDQNDVSLAEPLVSAVA